MTAFLFIFWKSKADWKVKKAGKRVPQAKSERKETA